MVNDENVFERERDTLPSALLQARAARRLWRVTASPLQLTVKAEP